MAQEEEEQKAPAKPTERSGVLVTLESIDDQKFTLPVEAAIMSPLVRDAINYDDDDDDTDERPTSYPAVPLLKLNGKTTQKVVEFLTHALDEPVKEIATPLEGNSFNEVSEGGGGRTSRS